MPLRVPILALRRALCAALLLSRTTATQSPPPVFSAELRELEFPNGMRAVIARTPPVEGRAPRAFAGLYLRYGSAAAGRPELAHLVEHIVANNAPALVNYVLPTATKVYGSNAMTRPDYMSFFRTVSPDALPDIIPNRANRVLGIRNDSAIFEREVGRVASEAQRRIDRIAASGLSAEDVLPSAFWGPQVSLAALLDSIHGFGRTAVFEQVERYLKPANALLVIAGDIDVDSIAALVTKHLSTYPARMPTPTIVGPAFVAYTRPLIVTDAYAIDPRVGIGLPAPERRDPEFLAYMILDQYLIGGRGLATDSTSQGRSLRSPLGTRLANAFSIADIDDGRDARTSPPALSFQSPSYATISFTVKRAMPTDSIAPRTLAALRGALTTDLTDDAIAKAKHDLSDYLGRSMLAPDLLPLGDHLAAFSFIDGSAKRLKSLPSEIDRVSLVRIRTLAARYVAPGMARIVIVAAH